MIEELVYTCLQIFANIFLFYGGDVLDKIDKSSNNCVLISKMLLDNRKEGSYTIHVIMTKTNDIQLYKEYI